MSSSVSAQYIVNLELNRTFSIFMFSTAVDSWRFAALALKKAPVASENPLKRDTLSVSFRFSSLARFVPTMRPPVQ